MSDHLAGKCHFIGHRAVAGGDRERRTPPARARSIVFTDRGNGGG